MSRGLLAAVSGVLAVVCMAAVMGFVPSLALAGHVDDDSFGIGSATSSVSAQVGILYQEPANKQEEAASTPVSPSDVADLAHGTGFDATAGVRQIEQQQEAERKAAEEAERLREQAIVAETDQAYAEWQGLAARDGSAAGVAGLEKVDWSCGKQAFLDEWTTRIDAYLEGSNLAGYGAVFAQAAWDNGMDPRWSPAVSNTESGKGSICFLPHNAWGWGSISWGSWEEAINAHVAGLAKGYGYSITLTYAGIYCPPNPSGWFANTVGEMKRI